METFRRAGGHCLKDGQPLRPPDTHPAGEAFVTLEAEVHVGHEAGVVVLLQVHGKELLLSEVFVAGRAGEGLLSRVCAHVRCQAPLLRGSGDIADTGWKSPLEPSSPLKSAVALLRARSCRMQSDRTTVQCKASLVCKRPA